MVEAGQIREHTKHLLTAQALRAGGRVRLRAFGTSMVPSIWPGDVLIIGSHGKSDLVTGDIVLVCRDDRFFVHRLVEIQRTQADACFVTRGDGSVLPDPPVAASAVLGKVERIERDGWTVLPRRTRPVLNRCLGAVLGRSPRLLAWVVRARSMYGRRPMVPWLAAEAAPEAAHHG